MAWNVRETGGNVADPRPGRPRPPAGRTAVDRRESKTPIFSRYSLLGGRRQHGRRQNEARAIYVDRYSWRVVLIFLGILVLNVLDAYFTLVYLQMGGTEANPVAQAYLDLGDLPFILVKSAVIGVCLVLLVIHKTFYAMPRILLAIFIFYSLLLVYHLVLQLVVVPSITVY